MLEIILREKDQKIYFIFTRKNIILDIKNKNCKKIYFWVIYFLNNKIEFDLFKNKNCKLNFKLQAFKIINDLLKVESENLIFTD
jgi:hypothetical protein